MENKSRLKPCPRCQENMSIDRGICPGCGYMTPWFRIRIYGGGCAILVFFLGIALRIAYGLIFGYDAPPPP